MMLDQKAKLIAEGLKEKSIADLPWTMIMEFIMQMVAMCFPSSAALLEAKNMGPVQKAALGVWIRREFGVRGMRKVGAIRGEILDQLTASSDQEVQQVWEEATAAVTPDLSVM